MSDLTKLPDGSKLAAMVAPEHAQYLAAIKSQLLIVLLRRLGGSITLPVSEIDRTGDVNLMLSVKPDPLRPGDQMVHLELRKKPVSGKAIMKDLLGS